MRDPLEDQGDVRKEDPDQGFLGKKVAARILGSSWIHRNQRKPNEVGTSLVHRSQRYRCQKSSVHRGLFEIGRIYQNMIKIMKDVKW